MGHSLEWTNHMRNVFVEKWPSLVKCVLVGWCRVVHYDSLGLGTQSRRSPPIPPLPALPILVKLGIESEAVKHNRAA